MRIIAFILSIFVLSMAIMPCEDGMDDAIFENTSQSHFDDQSHNHAQDKEDGCTPFCICTCCGTNIVLNFSFPPLISEINQCFLSEKVKINFYNTTFISDFYGNIWQPPKI
jgi:hypothetical protein